MILYEYLCPDCGKFEAWNTMAERGTTPCPQCGQSSNKVMSPVAFTFGWTLSDRSHERFGPRDEFVRDI